MSAHTKEEKSLRQAVAASVEAPRTITTDIPYPTNPIKVCKGYHHHLELWPSHNEQEGAKYNPPI